jgi:purine nucleosidase
VDEDETTPRAMLMGLDVTERAQLMPAHLEALLNRGGPTPLAGFIGDALRFYFEFHERYDGFYGAFVHDPMVVAAALDATLVRTTPVAVDVDTAGGIADGQTLADWRGLWGRTPNADVAVEGDGDAFLARWVERVGDLAAARANVAP